MKRLACHTASISLVALLLCPALIFGQTKVSAKLENYMRKQFEVNHFSGTVLVSQKGKVLLRKAYGLADAEWQLNNTPDTKFQLASVSKQFTAAAILLLVQEGKLSLEDKLSKFYPEFPKSDSVRIHMLLSHSSGLAMGFKELVTSTIPADEAFEKIKQMPYVFAPGSNTAYSNIGYYLLAKIIQKVSGKPYDRYLTENIFEKLGMKNSGVSNNDSLVLKKAKAYQQSGTGFIHNPYINWEVNRGHDGVYSTVDDLALWDKALYGTKLLSEASKELMFTSHNAQNWGYGFVINPFYNQGHKLIAHDGGFFGTLTSFNRYTDDQVFITVLSNNESFSHIIAYGLAAIVFGKEVELPYVHKAVQANPRLYEGFAGKYGDFEIIKTGDKLYFNHADMELLPESNTKFFRADNPDRTFEFVKDAKGKYSAVVITKGGVKERVQRRMEQ